MSRLSESLWTRGERFENAAFHARWARCLRTDITVAAEDQTLNLLEEPPADTLRYWQGHSWRAAFGLISALIGTTYTDHAYGLTAEGY